jgi:hypothetical protein
LPVKKSNGQIAMRAEGQYLEYKELPSPEPKDFLYDLAKECAAFANAYGGELVLGVNESKDDQGNKVFEVQGLTSESYGDLDSRFRNYLESNFHPASVVRGPEFREQGGGLTCHYQVESTYPAVALVRNRKDLYAPIRRGERNSHLEHSELVARIGLSAEYLSKRERALKETCLRLGSLMRPIRDVYDDVPGYFTLSLAPPVMSARASIVEDVLGRPHGIGSVANVDVCFVHRWHAGAEVTTQSGVLAVVIHDSGVMQIGVAIRHKHESVVAGFESDWVMGPGSVIVSVNEAATIVSRLVKEIGVPSGYVADLDLVLAQDMVILKREPIHSDDIDYRRILKPGQYSVARSLSVADMAFEKLGEQLRSAYQRWYSNWH